MEITKREILISIAILLVMITFGLFITSKIDNHLEEKNEQYRRAYKIENDVAIFNNAIKTDLGNAIVAGKIKGIDLVSYSDLTKKYLFVEKITEQYESHIETHTDSDGNTYTTTEYDWEHYDSDHKKSVYFEFLGRQFKTSKIELGGGETLNLSKNTVHAKKLSKTKGRYIYDTKRTFGARVGDKRHFYKVVKSNFNTVVFVKLKNSSMYHINGDDRPIHLTHYKTAAEFQEKEQSGKVGWIVLFWIGWVLLMGASLWGFVALENRWLED